MSSFNLTSPLFWVGSKRWQVPYIRALWHGHESRRYVEPFCGGLSMALGLEPNVALINDANPYLINFYRWLQHGWEYHESDHLPNTPEMYYTIRDAFNARLSHETLDDAKRFYALNRLGHKGLFRLNSEGKLNTAYGHRRGIAFDNVGTPNYTAYRHVIGTWAFTSGSYASIELRPDDFLYLDPPYDTEFTTYLAGGFTWNDQVAVAEWAAAHTGPVVLCNQATPRITQLYQDLGFDLSFATRVERMRSSNMSSAREVIATRSWWTPSQPTLC